MNDLLPLTVENAKKNRETLLSYLDGLKDAPVASLDVTGVEAVDLSGLQTLVAFAREASARGKELSFAGTLPECLSRALAVSGLAPSPCENVEDALAAIKAVCR